MTGFYESRSLRKVDENGSYFRAKIRLEDLESSSCDDNEFAVSTKDLRPPKKWPLKDCSRETERPGRRLNPFFRKGIWMNDAKRAPASTTIIKLFRRCVKGFIPRPAFPLGMTGGFAWKEHTCDVFTVRGGLGGSH